MLLSQVMIENQIALRLRAKVHAPDVQFEKAFASDVTERGVEDFGPRDMQPPMILHR